MGEGQGRGAGLPWASVALVPVEEADLDRVHAWQNDPWLRDHVMGFRLPIPREAVRDWLASLRPPGQGGRLLYAIRHEGETVGLAHLFGMQPFQRRAEIGLTVAEAARRGAGVGTVAASILIDFAVRGLDLRKLSAEVAAFNAPSLGLFERLGFVPEGLRRQEFFADGRPWDVHVLGLLREEWRGGLPPEARRLCAALPGA